MPPKVPANVSVDFSGATPVCNPDDVHVSKTANNKIIWTALQAGYTFTGVDITDDLPTGPDGKKPKEWEDPEITSVSVPKPGGTPGETITVSQMSVGDKFKDTTDHKYSLAYTDPSGGAHTYDPRIKNNP